RLGIPVTGGNVSFYNQTGRDAIHPTPVIGVLGVIDDVARRIPLGLGSTGDTIALIGTTGEELSGSEWAWTVHRHLGGVPPKVDLDHEMKLAELLARLASTEQLAAAHDLSEGGLAQALVEAVCHSGMGANILLPEG